MKKLALFICVLSLLVSSCTTPKASKSNDDIVVKSTIDKKVDSVLNLMTLEEKIGQMNQYNGFWDLTGPAPNNGDAANKYEHLKSGLVGSMLNVRGVANVRKVQKIAVEETRLGIPLIIGFDVIHGYETQSPIPLAESASWDLEAIKKSAEMAAKEAAAAGINWTFAPMVDISRDARWGRVMEGAGEDAFLGSKIAVARVKGFQGEDLTSANSIAACAKHFAAYGFAEGGKDYNTADIGLSTLYNTVLPPFKAASDAGVKTFMNSFNELNGIPATGDVFLQRELLKGQWGFDGFVVSDWGSIMEMIDHGYASDKKHAAELAVIAGSDMDMESYAYVKNLKALVIEGKVSEDLINDAARRILKVKFELGLFDDPFKYCNEQREKEVIGSKEIHDAALDMAKKSIVLLKNENNILPLKKIGQKIALIGALASDKNSPLGNWRLAARDDTAVSVLEAMQSYSEREILVDGVTAPVIEGAQKSSKNKILYAEGAAVSIGKTQFTRELTINTTDTSKFNEAIQLAKKSDVVVMVLGELGYQSGEGRSRADLGLPGVQQQLLEAVFKVNKNIVLVLNNGRPLAINWADKNIPAIVEAWQLGSQAGNGIAEVLYGDYNPSGKLPMTFPKSVAQVPLYYNYKHTGRPGPKEEVFWSHYQDETNEALYPFGYGLSYTTFAYSNLSTKIEGKEVTVKVAITNTGNVKGKEVVQLYVRDIIGSVTRPVKELKGFELIALNPNETKTVTFNLTEAELGFFNNQGKFVFEPGAFTVFVGGSSKTALETNIKIQ